MAKLTIVEGIGAAYAEKLASIGIVSTKALLARGATPQGREEIAAKTGISPKLLLRWVSHIDLFRIKGVGEEYADLLERAGVNAVPGLAQSDPEELHKRIVKINAEKKLVRQLPGLNQVREWIAQARRLPRKLVY